MRFQQGNEYGKGGAREGSGRPLSKKTQLKRWEDDNPRAYGELMYMLYEKGKKGNSEDAKYVCDRLKGRAKQSLDIKGKIDFSADDILRAVLEARDDQSKELDSIPQLTSYNNDTPMTETTAKPGENQPDTKD